MTIRTATEHDIPSIVGLLKISLGESLMPKSEAFWRWKHIDNPFGKSPVLLAFENDELIGVRAFMRWEWRQGDKIYKAVRAVDTATHPEYRGKGIFKKLTLSLVDQCKEEGIDFIFNTPNRQSKPGYLKMGWESVGQLPVKIKVQLINKKAKKTPIREWNTLKDNPIWESRHISSDKLKTRISPEYLLWRYRDNPNARYDVLSIADNEPFILVYRRKKFNVFTEIRITELLCKSGYATHAINFLAGEKLSPCFITLSGSSFSFIPYFTTFGAGPEVTVRNLNLNSRHEKLNFASWAPSLGDLELF